MGRLQTIVNKTEKVGGYSLLITIDDVDWLIEQAQKVEQLQKENFELNKEIGKYTNELFRIADLNNDLTARLERLARTMLGND